MFRKNQKLNMKIDIQLSYDLFISYFITLDVYMELLLDKANDSLINLYYYGIDHHDIITSEDVPTAHIMWLPTLSDYNHLMITSLYNSYNTDDWVQISDFLIFGFHYLQINHIGNINIKEQTRLYNRLKEDKKDELSRIENQASHVLSYLNMVNETNLPIVDLGSGDGDLSFILKDSIDHYIPIDIKLGYTSIGVKNVLSSLNFNFIILARNSFHHIPDIAFIDNLPFCTGIIVIDYFDLATLLGSLYHHVYSEFVYFRSVQNICFNLKTFNSIKRLDADVNVTGPTAYFFSRMSSSNLATDFNINRFQYDDQFINSDLTVNKFDRSRVVFQSGMLRLLQDYFFQHRFILSGGDFKYSSFNDIHSYVSKVREYITYNKEIKPDDIFMWFKVISNNNHFNVMSDPFAGWFSRGLAFALVFWNDSNSIFYWYDIDYVKSVCIISFVDYLNSSGCKTKFVQLGKHTNAMNSVVLVSPFYMNFEPVDSVVNSFTSVDDWADYVISFIFSKVGTLYPFIIQIDNYKEYNMKDALFERLGSANCFSMSNDLGYFRSKVSFISCMYNDRFKPRFYCDGLISSLLTVYENKHKDVLNMFGSICYVECDGVLFSSLINSCGHYGSRSVYRGVRWHHGQLKLICLLFIVAKCMRKPTVIIYLGSGNHTSYLTNYGISWLSKDMIFILVDKYPQHVKMFKGNTNIKIFNGFMDSDTLDDILSLYNFKSTDSVLVLSDVRRGMSDNEARTEYINRRGSEFEDEIVLLRQIKSKLSFVNDINFCLKINYSKEDYFIPDGDLFYVPFIDAELRLLTDLGGNVKMSTSKFDCIYKDLFNSCFKGEVCYACQVLKLITKQIF